MASSPCSTDRLGIKSLRPGPDTKPQAGLAPAGHSPEQLPATPCRIKSAETQPRPSPSARAGPATYSWMAPGHRGQNPSPARVRRPITRVCHVPRGSGRDEQFGAVENASTLAHKVLSARSPKATAVASRLPCPDHLMDGHAQCWRVTRTKPRVASGRHLAPDGQLPEARANMLCRHAPPQKMAHVRPFRE